jgi:hypothetical protein
MLETLVALLITVLAMTVALAMYDVVAKSFHKDEDVTEQQQGVRIGFDAMIADLQLAGLNYNPDGSATRPDEQIEGAFGAGLVFRADFDGRDASTAAIPEASLAGGGSDTVSIGNDEIVAFALSKPGSSHPGSFTFSADVAEVPRNGVVETVTIPGVAIVQDEPPYTLYRITLNNDIATWGSGDFLVWTPVMENVASLAFRYFDANGTELTSIGGAETTAAIGTRSKIRRIQVDVVGLTRNPERVWRDPADPNPLTSPFRKFRLTGDVTPRNLGRAGARDLRP